MNTVESILKSLTIEEKLRLTYGNSNWTFFGVNRLGLKELLCGDGPHGLRAYNKDPEHDVFDRNSLAPTTLFPVASAMASTFEPELLYHIGKAIGEECNMHNVDLLLAPGVNMKRSPLGGRNFEYYSEDPYLTGVCATSFINGVQSTGVGATIKHYALNEQENQRRFLNTIVDEQTMHEFYLRPFYYAITHSNPMAIMSSYNQINGHYGSESSYLLQDVLRSQWNYDGMVISDWGAVQHKIKSIKTGMNIEMPGPSEFKDELNGCIERGELTEEELDDSLRPLIAFYLKTQENKRQGEQADLKAHHEIARKVAEEAIVLLENDGVLPLKRGRKIGVIGTFAKTPRINGGGSATLRPFIEEVPLTELQNHFTVEYAAGYDEETTNETLLKDVQSVCENNDLILYFTGTTTALETEGKDREHMNLPEGHIRVFEEIASSNKDVVVILQNGSALNVTPLLGKANAIVESWLLGGANSVPLVQVLLGTINPSGRLTETFPVEIEHTPHFGQFPSKLDEVHYNGDIINNGYRYYDTHHYPVQYPFGYGLSYTEFKYSDISVDKTVLKDQGELEVRIRVQNTGERYGKEVVQLYIGAVESYYPRPRKELKAFQKIGLQPGETQIVRFTLKEEDFSVYAPDFKEYRGESGDYIIYVGQHVNDENNQTKITYETSKLLRKNLTLEHPLKNFKLYKKAAFDLLEKEVGTFAWYNIEEPTIRVLKRLQRRHSWSDETRTMWEDTLLR